LGVDDWNALHSGKHNEELQLCAFDVLAMDGDDLRDLPLSMRKANLQMLLARRPRLRRSPQHCAAVVAPISGIRQFSQD
jgi:ATP-dependent DNA ligase